MTERERSIALQVLAAGKRAEVRRVKSNAHRGTWRSSEAAMYLVEIDRATEATERLIKGE